MPADRVMERYLVGGAVRDALLGLPVRERDWVVVGASPEDMREAGFRPVGRDFPVFLHPDTQEEHALARTERKSGPGYRGFAVSSDPGVTLEQDLLRRDLTINAIAMDAQGRLIDPHGGQSDLSARVLRHVSPAFAEDPVRILRVARFAARFAPMGFRVADETLALMRRMVESGEANALVAERVWKETERALFHHEEGAPDGHAAPSPYRPGVFFEILRNCGALACVMPELAALDGVPQRPDYHPEVDTLVHTLMCVDAAARMDFAPEVRVATLLHDLGKAATPARDLPSHPLHDVRGMPLVENFCARLRVPNAARDLALAVTRDHLNVHRARELRPATLLEMIERFRGFQTGPFFDQALDACLCDARGRKGFENCDYPPVAFMREARGVASKVQAPAIVNDGFSGPAVGVELHRRRTEALAAWKSGLARPGMPP